MPHTSPAVRPALRPALALLTALAAAAAGCAGGSFAGTGKPAMTATAPPPSEGRAVPAAPPSSIAPASVVLDGPGPAAPPDERPGLATAWGETTWSPITTTPFVRAEARPWATAVLHYNDADGVRAHASYVGAAIAPLEAYAGSGDVAVALIDDGGDILPGVAVGGRNLVAATDGARYRIAVRNLTEARFEVVTSVDGLDVLDGRPAGFDRRGYVIEPHGELIIDGFRQSNDEVAAFRFGRVASSYAARTTGDANVGVIGVALFAERGARWTPAELERRDRAAPFPGEPGRGYAAAP
ncbi:MAG: hypothetical protein IPL61_11230 [Myxococcales bacterium]|nr:hypothetical protein [Myxococcales bacterium]